MSGRPTESAAFEQVVEGAKMALGERELKREWDAGASLTLGEAIDPALSA